MLQELMICNNIKKLFAHFSGAPEADNTMNKNVDVELVYLTHRNIGIVNSINSECLPIQYSTQYYNMVVRHRELCRLAYVSGAPVGAICCRALPISENDVQLDEYVLADADQLSPDYESAEISRPLTFKFNTDHKKKMPIQYVNVYIMSLAVLPKYRRLGIGRKLVEWLYKTCQEINNGTYECVVGGLPYVNPSKPVKIEKIELHAWAANESAPPFYKSVKFTLDNVIENFYCNLEPTTAYHFTRRIEDEPIN